MTTMPEIAPKNMIEQKTVSAASNNVVQYVHDGFSYIQIAPSTYKPPEYLDSHEMVARAEVLPNETLRYTLARLRDAQKWNDRRTDFVCLLLIILVILRAIRTTIAAKANSNDGQNLSS